MRNIILMAVLLVTGLLYGCGGSGSTTPVSVKQTPMAVFMYGSVVDAATGNPVPNAGVTVAGATVYSQSGAALPATVTAGSDGQIALALPQVPTQDTNLVFAVTANGYIVNNYTLAVKANPNTKIYQFSVPLVADTTDANGIVSKTATNVSTLSATANGATTTVTLASGTVLTDANGAVLDSTKLKLKVTTYNANTQTVNALAPNAGEAFMSAGFADITVTDGTRTAVALSKPVTIRVDFAAGTLNPATQAPIAKDDIITVYTFDKTKGTWTADKINTFDAGTGAWVLNAAGDVTVQQAAGGGLYVEYQATHFSYWNIGYRGVVCGNINVPLTGDSSVPLSFTITPGLVGTQTLLTGTKTGGDTTLILQKMPNNGTTFTLKAFYNGGAVPVGSVQVKSCAVLAPGAMAITVPVPLDPFSFTVEKKCSVKNSGGIYLTEAMPNVTVYSCPSSTVALPVPPTPTCAIIGVTNSSGVATGSTPDLAGHKIFVRPNATYTWPYGSTFLTPKSATGATPLTFDYVSTWSFCPVTGANGEMPLVP